MINYEPYIEIKQVQRRTHKNKRINKKWLKRYGMRFELWINGALIERDANFKIRNTSSEKYYRKNYEIRYA